MDIQAFYRLLEAESALNTIWGIWFTVTGSPVGSVELTQLLHLQKTYGPRTLTLPRPEDVKVVGVGGTWDLKGLHIGVPAGCYCDAWLKAAVEAFVYIGYSVVAAF